MFITTNCIKLVGAKAQNIKLECSIEKGIGIHLIGLADATVKESLLRTVTALQANGYHIPGKKIIINLTPTDLLKNGSGYDLAIALAIIAATEQMDMPNLENWLILGELGLDGTLRTVPGELQALLTTKENNLKGCIIPRGEENFLQPFAEGIRAYAAGNLNEAIEIIRGTKEYPTIEEMELKESTEEPSKSYFECAPGNEAAKRAIEIAAAGGHNILLVGAPGSGKASLAKAYRDILPPMTKSEALETAELYSAGGHYNPDAKRRPFRAPHISTSMSAMYGGGAGEYIVPGEVSLANNGVLYMDEFAEIPKAKLETMRATIEDKKVTISRLKSRISYSTKYHLVAATNPCPCGYYGEGDRCTCTKAQRLLYLSRLNGPVMDQITMQAWTHTVPFCVPDKYKTETCEEVQKRVLRAREIQKDRFRNEEFNTNDQMQSKHLSIYCPLSEESSDILEKIMISMELSARAYTRIIKIARTIADLDEVKDILPHHIAEAASFRFMDRRGFYEEKNIRASA